jgi:hypothetical protein
MESKRGSQRQFDQRGCDVCFSAVALLVPALRLPGDKTNEKAGRKRGVRNGFADGSDERLYTEYCFCNCLSTIPAESIICLSAMCLIIHIVVAPRYTPCIASGIYQVALSKLCTASRPLDPRTILLCRGLIRLSARYLSSSHA